MNAPQSTPFTMLVDGMCPVCMHEVRLLRRLDRGRGRLAFVDIAAPEFDASAFGRTQDEVMGEIHGVGPDGSLITGMEVFRRAYRAVGWGWLWAPTGWRVFRPIFDALYRVFARNRVRWFRKGGCESGTCKVPGASAPTPKMQR
jgi:predicted DCC family thiol-disulfide oxidoreductase YuxK